MAWQLGMLIDLEPANTSRLSDARGTALAELGHWQAAKEHFRRARESDSSAADIDVQIEIRRARLLLAAGDRAAYRTLCRQLAGDLRVRSDLGGLCQIEGVCGLQADALSDPQSLVSAIETAIDAARGAANGAAIHPSADGRGLPIAVALVAFRAGNLDDAKRRCLATLAAPTSDPAETPLAWLAMSLIESRRGDRQSGRVWLEKAVQWIDRETNEATRGRVGLRLTWLHRFDLNMLRQEAESAVNAH